FVTKNAPFLFYSDGGAGTTPMFIIEPSGSVQATSFLGDGSTLTGVVRTAGDTMTGALTIQNNLTVTGKVGIATTAPPSERLEVNGNIKATSFLGRIDAVNITSGTLNVERIPNLSAEKITSGTLTGSYSINGNLSITFDSYFGCQSQDRFTYDNKSIGHYSLGWFRDSWQTNGPTAWLSSFGGIKFFTTGQPRLMIDALGKVSVTGNLSVTNILEIGDTPFTGNTGGNRDWMQKGIKINWDTDSLFIGLKDEGSDRKDAVIAWGDNTQDDLRFINVAGGDVQGKELMRIKPSGNVGIGTNNPQQKLHIDGGHLTITNNGNTFTISVERDRVVFYLSNAYHGNNKRISWDGDNNWDEA
ncbi:hypothetical protein, partial [Microcystis sp. M049S2]|uniref:hypothetical protein n=1 Tax=Microcystis sp. M049S2 TaxID=2771169 RepID=UPI00258C4B8A